MKRRRIENIDGFNMYVMLLDLGVQFETIVALSLVVERVRRNSILDIIFVPFDDARDRLASVSKEPVTPKILNTAFKKLVDCNIANTFEKEKKTLVRAVRPVGDSYEVTINHNQLSFMMELKNQFTKFYGDSILQVEGDEDL